MYERELRRDWAILGVESILIKEKNYANDNFNTSNTNSTSI